MEDCCTICAEPLEWVAYGPCGHRGACSKCVIRLRFVLKDQRCVSCQCESSRVFVTRWMGDFTAKIPGDELEKFNPQECNKRGLFCLRKVEAYFDDKDHFERMRGLCSFTHPVLERENAHKKLFPSLKELRTHLSTTFGLHLCTICLEHRKIFVSEHEVYTKAELDRHMKKGDVSGPLAESGFPGHPQCRFCKKRFFGDNEIYEHMERSHERCFICRKANPESYVYYKDYAELEDHFRSSHFLCQDAVCLENKFVVFSTEAELNHHMAKEHKNGLTRCQRRTALALETAFQYDRGVYGQQQVGGPAVARPPAIVIGGGAGLYQQSSGGRRGHAGSAAAMHERDMLAAMEESRRLAEMDAQRAHDVAFDPEDFPAAAAAGGSLPSYAGAGSGSGRWLSRAASTSGSNALTEEDFPALPGTSKSARRHAKQRASAARAAQGSSSHQPQPQPRGPGLHHSSSAPSFNPAPPASAPAGLGPSQQQQQQRQRQGPAPNQPSAPRPPPVEEEEEWPQVGGAAAPGTAAPLRWGVQRQPSRAEPPAAAGPHAPPPGSLEDFPTLPAASPRGRGAAGSRPRPPQRAAPGPLLPPARPQAPPEVAAPVPETVLSESVREANRLLVDKIKQKVDPGAFEDFKAASKSLNRGEVSTDQYFQKVLELGLLSLTPEIAALCPDPRRRGELLEAFRRHATAPGAGPGGWTPPEAVEAFVQQAMENSSWQCPRCGMTNGPGSHLCDGCALGRAAAQPAAEDSTEALETELSASAPKKGKKGKKSKFERLRLSENRAQDNRASASNDGEDARGTSSQRQAVGARGAWGNNGGARLAQAIGVVNDAWGTSRR